MEPDPRRPRLRRPGSAFVWPLLLIAAGIVLLLQNFGMLDWDALKQWWPVGLIAAGLLMLIPRRD